MNGWMVGVLVAVGLLGGGCASRPVAAVEPPGGAPFPAAAGLLSGFDPQEVGADWRNGDSVLLGLTLHDGSGSVRESYLRITVGERLRIDSGSGLMTIGDSAEITITPKNGDAPFTLRARFDLVALLVEMFDEHGTRVSHTIAMMPEPCLRYGLTEFIEIDPRASVFDDPAQRAQIVDGKVDVTPAQLRAMAGWLALFRLPEFMQREKSVNGIVQTVMRPPGLGSIIRNLGVSVSLGLNPEQAEKVEPPPPWTGVCYRVPLAVEANGRSATDCMLTLTRADPPLGPCNGLLALEASRPDDPSRRLSVKLLAARRGQAAAQEPAK